MNHVTIKLNEIVILPQPRKTFSDIDTLADDIRDHGLLQYPTVTKDKRLLYGERRVRACRLLGMEDIPVFICEETLSDDEILERQIAENVARDDLSWQERALSLLDLWRIKRQRGMLEGWTWGNREASSLFKISLGTVNYVLRVAKKLEAELQLPEDKRKYWAYSSANEAWRMGILAEEQDKLTAEMAKRTLQQVNDVQPPGMIPEVSRSESEQDIVEVIEVNDEARARYESNSLNTQPYEEYLAEKRQLEQERAKKDEVIHISNILHHGDCIEFMNRPENESRFDHIITDIPYGIDMEMLNQNNTHGGMQDIDRIVDTHDVDDNMKLHVRFFHSAFRCTKDHAYVITFADMMQFQRMYDIAIDAGFAVQRWPLIWRKINQSVMNNCAGYNTTKDYEIAIVCRKPGATLANKLNTSILEGSNTVPVKDTGHPFAKPYEVATRIIEAVSRPSQVILEPFAGGGSIALSILRANRQVIACELETHHFNLLMENLKREYFLKLNPNFKFK